MKIVQLGTGKVLWESSETRANLYRANLCRADLRGADLRGVNLYGANLYRANLRGANLYGANLYRANLYGANLIVGGYRSDGYQFFGFKEEDGTLRIRAGCRYFMAKQAKEHWSNTRGGTKLGLESLALVDCISAFAIAAGWKVETGE